MNAKKSPESAQAGDRQPLGDGPRPSAPKTSAADTHLQHTEAFAALLNVAAKPQKKSG